MNLTLTKIVARVIRKIESYRREAERVAGEVRRLEDVLVSLEATDKRG
jgi:hypothetical protein